MDDTHLKFLPFNLKKLMDTIFKPKKGEKVAILIDLDNPKNMDDLSKHLSQKMAYEIFYKGIKRDFNELTCDFFAYQKTGGSNLELPEEAYDLEGKKISFKNIYSTFNIILCIGTYSATAPLTASAKKFQFRGGTLHGLNEVILKSGLAVDYNDVSKQTEIFRKALTLSDCVDIEFQLKDHTYHLHLDLEKQEAQKSHGLCHNPGEIVNLPAGEVYFVPKNAEGSFPIKLEDGTLGLMNVNRNRVFKISFIEGDIKKTEELQKKLDQDPATGYLGELGFGTQKLPFAEADIQDEKCFGTFHLATGRNDHLKGDIVKECFNDLKNATHDDILYSPTKTPEIKIKHVIMEKEGKKIILIENDQPSLFLLNLCDTKQKNI